MLIFLKIDTDADSGNQMGPEKKQDKLIPLPDLLKTIATNL
jgi:hypothetical protein